MAAGRFGTSARPTNGGSIGGSRIEGVLPLGSRLVRRIGNLYERWPEKKPPKPERKPNPNQLYDDETIAHARWLFEVGRHPVVSIIAWLGSNYGYTTRVLDYSTRSKVFPRKSDNPADLPRKLSHP